MLWDILYKIPQSITVYCTEVMTNSTWNVSSCLFMLYILETAKSNRKYEIISRLFNYVILTHLWNQQSRFISVTLWWEFTTIIWSWDRFVCRTVKCVYGKVILLQSVVIIVNILEVDVILWGSITYCEAVTLYVNWAVKFCGAVLTSREAAKYT